MGKFENLKHDPMKESFNLELYQFYSANGGIQWKWYTFAVSPFGLSDEWEKYLRAQKYKIRAGTWFQANTQVDIEFFGGREAFLQPFFRCIFPSPKMHILKNHLIIHVHTESWPF